MLEYRTQGYSGCNVQYSPFFDSYLAVAASANFGLVGNGRLYILRATDKGVEAQKWYDTQDALYDVCWSESHEQQAVVASGDGSIKLYDITLDQFPIQTWREHSREVYSVGWNLVGKDSFATSSWDGSVKIWRPDVASSLLTIPVGSCTYSAAFSPHSASVVSTVSSDCCLRVFDVRMQPTMSAGLTVQLPLHSQPPRRHGGHSAGSLSPPSEMLTHDWNKYRDTVVAVAGVDRLVRTFDLRAPHQGPLATLSGHQYAVRRLAWSPHLPDVLLSASYDMTARVWTDGSGAGAASGSGGRELGRMGRHTEFVVGLDWCLFGAEGWCATCGWDEMVYLWDTRAA